MKKKYLLGAIIGDILHSTFTDRNFVYDRDKPILSEKSNISGYTVITLAIAKFIMENNQLYEGRSEAERSEKRMELVAETILELAKNHPELKYPEWLNKWLESGKYIPTKDKDGMLAICFSPLMIYFWDKIDLESLLRVISETIDVISVNKDTVLGTKILTTVLYGENRYSIEAVQDLLACLYSFRWSRELNDLESKYGWKTSVVKAMDPALCVLYQGDHEFCSNLPVTKITLALADIIRINGISSLVTPLVVTMMQAMGGLVFEEQESFRALLPEDLLKINDVFFKFIGEYVADYHGAMSLDRLLDLL